MLKSHFLRYVEDLLDEHSIDCDLHHLHIWNKYRGTPEGERGHKLCSAIGWRQYRLKIRAFEKSDEYEELFANFKTGAVYDLIMHLSLQQAVELTCNYLKYGEYASKRNSKRFW